MRSIVLSALLLGLAANVQADCKGDYISCVNSCLLPGLASAVAKKGDASAFKSCSTPCEQRQTACEVQEAEHERLENLQRERAAAQERSERARVQAEQQARDAATREANEQRYAAIRAKYPDRVVLETSALLGGETMRLDRVAELTNASFWSAVLDDVLFYIDRPSKQLMRRDLVTGQTAALAFENVRAINKLKDGNKRYVLVESRTDTPNEIAVFLINARGEMVSKEIHTGLPAFNGQKGVGADLTVLYGLSGRTLVASTWIHTIHFDGSKSVTDTEALEVRAFDIDTGAAIAAMKFADARSVSTAFVAGRPIVYVASAGRDTLTGYDLLTQAQRSEQPLSLGSVARSDNVWVSVAGGAVNVSRRSDDQKRESSAWFDAATGALRCKFDGNSSFSEPQQRYGVGNQVFDAGCYPLGVFPAVGDGILFAVGKVWGASYPNNNYKRRAFDASGKPLSQGFFEAIVDMDGAGLLLIPEQPIVRVVTPEGVVTELPLKSEMRGYHTFDSGYLITSGFEKKSFVHRFVDNQALKAFMKAQDKDDYETSAQYRQRIASLKTEVVSDVEVGRFDADTASLPIALAGQSIQLFAPAEEAKRFRGITSAKLRSVARPIEPGLVEIVAATLEAPGIAPLKLSVPTPKPAVAATNPTDAVADQPQTSSSVQPGSAKSRARKPASPSQKNSSS